MVLTFLMAFISDSRRGCHASNHLESACLLHIIWRQPLSLWGQGATRAEPEAMNHRLRRQCGRCPPGRQSVDRALGWQEARWGREKWDSEVHCSIPRCWNPCQCLICESCELLNNFQKVKNILIKQLHVNDLFTLLVKQPVRWQARFERG